MFIDYCKLTNSLTVDILGMNEKVLEMFFQTLEILTKPKCRDGINFRDSYILSNQMCITRNRLHSSARNYFVVVDKNRVCHFVILTQICRLLLLATARGNEVEFF